ARDQSAGSVRTGRRLAVTRRSPDAGGCVRQAHAPGGAGGPAVMMRGLGGIIYKEFIQITRNPATLAITLLIPIIQLIIFGYAIDTEVRNVRTYVLDLDNTPQSREFINRFRATGLYDMRGNV